MESNYRNLGVMRWTGTVMGITGATLVASNTEFSKYAFPIFLLSAVLWAAVAYIIKDRALLLLQLVFMCVDAVGIYRWFF